VDKLCSSVTMQTVAHLSQTRRVSTQSERWVRRDPNSQHAASGEGPDCRETTVATVVEQGIAPVCASVKCHCSHLGGVLKRRIVPKPTCTHRKRWKSTEADSLGEALETTIEVPRVSGLDSAQQ